MGNKWKTNFNPENYKAKNFSEELIDAKSGKIVELTIKKIIHNERIENLGSIANPETLDDYKNIKELNY